MTDLCGSLKYKWFALINAIEDSSNNTNVDAIEAEIGKVRIVYLAERDKCSKLTFLDKLPNQMEKVVGCSKD